VQSGSFRVGIFGFACPQTLSIDCAPLWGTSNRSLKNTLQLSELKSLFLFIAVLTWFLYSSKLYNLLCWLQNAMFYKKNTQFIVKCINYYWLCPDYWQMIESRISFWFYLEMHGNTELIINDWSVKNNLYNLCKHFRAGRRQPDNREGNEFCVGVLNNFYNDGVRFHDISCHHRKPIICES